MSDDANNSTSAIDLAFATTEELVAEIRERTEVSIVAFAPKSGPGVYAIHSCGTLLNVAGMSAAVNAKVQSLVRASLKGEAK